MLVLAITIPALYLNPGFGSIYVDYTVGAAFAALLVVIHQEIDRPKRLLLFIPLIFAMAALKQIGLTLSNLTAVFLLYLMFKKRCFHYSYILFIACLVTLPQIVDYMWAKGFLEKFTSGANNLSFLEKLQIASTQIQTEYGLKVALEFIKAFTTFFFTRTGGIIFSTFVIISALFIKRNAQSDAFKNVKLFFKASILILLLYAFHRVVLYLSVYSADHALSITSLKRYLCSLLIGILGLILYLCRETFIQLPQDQYNKLKKHVKFFFVIIIIALAARLYKKPYLALPEDRQLVLTEINAIYPHLKAGKKVYILPHNFNLGDCFYYHFESTPYAKKTNISECFKTTNHETFEKYDATTADFDIKKFSSENYDILYIPRSETKLRKQLQDNFHIHSAKDSIFILKEGKFTPSN